MTFGAALTEDERRIVLAKLPASGLDLVDRLGFDDAMVVIRRLGGTRLFLGKRSAPAAAVIHAVGEPIARKLVELCSGNYVELPRATAALRELSHRQMRAEHRAGRTVSEIALAHEVTARSVRIVLAKGRRDEQGATAQESAA